MSAEIPLMTAFIGYYDEQKFWRSVYLNKPHLTIGRADTCDIVINDPKTSSFHADLYFCNSAWMVADHGSRNGLFINNQRVQQAVLLRHQDTLQIGDHVLHFRFSSDANQPTLHDVSGLRQAALVSPGPGAAPRAIELSPRQAERAQSALARGASTALSPGGGSKTATPPAADPPRTPPAPESERPGAAPATAALLGRIEELMVALHEQRGQTAAAQSEATDWLRRANALRTDLEERTREQHESAARESRLREELHHATEGRLKLQGEVATLQQTLQEVERALRTQAEAAAREREIYRRDTTELRSNLSALTLALAECEKQVRQHKATIAERDYRVLRQGEEIDTLRAAYERLDSELAESQRRRNEHSAQTRALRENLERATAEYEARLASGDRERRRLARQIDQLTSERAAAASSPASTDTPQARPACLPALGGLQKTVPLLRATAERALWASVGKRALNEQACDELKEILEQLYAYSSDLVKLTQEFAS